MSYWHRKGTLIRPTANRRQWSASVPPARTATFITRPALRSAFASKRSPPTWRGANTFHDRERTDLDVLVTLRDGTRSLPDLTMVPVRVYGAETCGEAPRNTAGSVSFESGRCELLGGAG